MSDPTNLYASLQAPYSQEAEEATLGAILVNPVAYFAIAAFLKADDFFLLRHRYIWESLTRLHERGEPIDYLTVLQELKDTDHLIEIGGPGYLTQLINNTENSANGEMYARIVERTSLRRRMMSASDHIKALALNEALTVEQVIAESEAKLFDVTERKNSGQLIPIHAAVNNYFDRIDYLMSNKNVVLGVPTGFRDMDKLLGGFQKSDLIIFAGRPGMGKTSFMLSAALNMARLNARIAIFSMEMGADQIVQRLISMESGINTQNLRLGQLTQQEFTRFVHAAGNLSRLNIFIDDTAAMSPLEMRTKCLRLQREHGLDLIVVDYLQLMNASGMYENNRVQEISYISRAMKELAREFNVPLVSAAQLSRAVEQRQDKRPQLSDLRESGSIEQDADVVMFLYRDEVYNEATEFPNQADVIVAKHRNGPTGTVSLYFEKTLTKFMNAAERSVDLRQV
jgi:replicative DNA helicase